MYLANHILATVNADQRQYSSALRNVEEAVSLAKVIKKDDCLLHSLHLSAQVSH